MPRHLVLVGGGHAHLTALLNMARFTGRGHAVTLVSQGPFHHYSGMGPGMLGGIYRPEDLRFNVRRMVEDRGGRFVQGKARFLAPEKRILTLESGQELTYDVISFNVGSTIPGTVAQPGQEDVSAVKPIENLHRLRQRVLAAVREGVPRLTVVGGGPAAFEVAGNLERAVRESGGQARITLFAGRAFFGHLPARAGSLARRSLTRRSVDIVERAPVRTLCGGRLILETGEEHRYDLAVLAVGVRVGEIFRESGLPTAESGELLVNRHLQSVRFPEIFGGGDCIQLPDASLSKVGVYAVRENPVLAHNLLAALEGGVLRSFRPQKHTLLLFNAGDGSAILLWRGISLQGRPFFLLKNRIDLSFVRRFQVSGEQASGEGV